ncbi:Rv3235 family protein [Streptomyces sp. NPDC060194]|uniref:Rv3235 family protein n=1 Tax=Streptomyces sp. NPDC060194 TaxID=3347069 RepID=UPI00365955AE
MSRSKGAGTRPGTGSRRPAPSAPRGAARSDSRRPGDHPPRVPVQRPPHPTELFTERLLAVLSGRRPAHWLLRHSAGSAYDELIRLGEAAPLRLAGPLPVVRDIGWFQPCPEVYEVFARISAGHRLHALAFRLQQGADQRWRCTAVDAGGR